MKRILFFSICYLFFFPAGRSQVFRIDDMLVSAVDAQIGDPEFDPYQHRICWQSLDDDKLWVCSLDTVTWALVEPYGKEILIDSSLTPLANTSNSGEWGFELNGAFITYNKLIDKVRYIAIASETQLGWLSITLMDAPHRINPHATRNPNDSVAAIHYIRSPFSVNTKYKFLNDPGNEHAVSFFRDAHWAQDEQLLTGIFFNDQVGLFDPANPGIPIQITMDTAADYSIPFMWRAPEHGNARMFFARANCNEIRVFKETSPNSHNYSLYMQFYSPSSNPLYTQIASPEPIVYEDQSYITFMASSSPYENANVPAEIWIAKIDSLEPVFRMVSDTIIAIRTDPEPYPLQNTLLTYYTEVIDPLSPEPIYRIRKCETGFGSGYVTGLSEKNELTGKKWLIYPNPFKNRITLQHATGKEYFILADSRGQTIWMGKQIGTIDFSELAVNMYLLKVISGHTVQTFQLVKE